MTRKVFTPRDYQPPIIDHILQTPRCAVWAGMGMGKTSATLTALDMYNVVDDSPALILGPLRVAKFTWPDEAKEWEHLRDTHIVPVVGTPEERRAALRTPATSYSINYEQLPWLVEHYGKKWPFRKIVADESTKLKSFRLRQGGQRARELGRAAHCLADRFIELTGTPSPNGLLDLWGQMWFLDRGERLGRTYQAYVDRYFKPVRIGADAFAVKHIAHEWAQAEIENKLRDLCITLDAKDYFELTKPIRNTVRIQLPSKVRRYYDDMEREMFFSLGENDIEAVNAAAKTIKCLQIANGAIYLDDKGNFQELHDMKLQALESVINEAGGSPVLVAYHFKSDLALLRKAFPKALLLSEDSDLIRAKNGEGQPWLAHPQSLGHGVDGLQKHCHHIAFYGHWWDLETRLQIIERVGPTRQAQAGFNRPVFITDIIAQDTIDETVLARHETKASVQDLLLAAMKRRITK